MNLHDITKKYILNDTELVIIETIINELSKGNVSTTVIVKLAKKLGFVGYSQMLYVLNESIHQKVSIENLSDLSEFVNNDDIETVQKLIDDIYQHKHEKIYLVGVGFSDIITHYFLKRLASFDILIVSMHEVTPLSLFFFLKVEKLLNSLHKQIMMSLF